MLVAVLGGLLGILMMIPLRRALIVQQHGILKYPEGTACAEVLKAGASAESRAAASPAAKREQALARRRGHERQDHLHRLRHRPRLQGAERRVQGLEGRAGEGLRAAVRRPARSSAEISPELLGVGYIIGPRIAVDHVRRRRARRTWSSFRRSSSSATGCHEPLAPGHRCRSARWRPDDIRERLRPLHRRRRGGRRRHHQPAALAADDLEQPARRAEGLARRRSGARRRACRDRPRPLDEGRAWSAASRSSSRSCSRRPLHMNLVGALLIVVLGFLFVTVSSRLTGEIGSSSNPISGMTVATLLFTCLVFLLRRLDRAGLLRHGAVGRRDRLHRLVERRHDVAGSEDRLPGRRDAAQPADRHPRRRARLGAGARSDPAAAQRRGDGVRAAHQQGAGRRRAGPTLRDVENFPATLRVDRGDADRHGDLRRPRVPGLAQAVDSTAGRPASTWSTRAARRSTSSIRASTARIATRPDGTRQVAKFDAPKATLMSYIIKGILNRELPWGLVLLGVMIAVVLEMSGIAVAGVCGRRLSAALVDEPDLHRRHGPLARRSARAEEASRPAA